MSVAKAFLLIRKIVLSPGAFGKYLLQCLKLYRHNDLLQFANEQMTDKGYPGHNYVRVYDFFLRDRRDKDMYLCEIGLHLRRAKRDPHAPVYPAVPSLRMWRKYLPNAHIVGFDIQKFTELFDEKCTILCGDQSSREDLQKIIDHHSGYDVIIDDALHASPHQQITLSYLFTHLKSGGLYFIEDLNSQPEGFERTEVPRTVEVLRKFAATGVWSSPLSTPEEKKTLETQVKEIHFFESLKGADPINGADAIAVIIKK